MLHMFISKIYAAKTEDGIIEIFNSEEGPVYEQIVNSKPMGYNCLYKKSLSLQKIETNNYFRCSYMMKMW